MRNRWIAGVALWLACSTALAQETKAAALAVPAPEAPRPAQQPARWSFGAGVGLLGYNLGSVVGPGAAGALGSLSGTTLLGVGLLERTLTPSLRLGLAASGGYSRRNTDSHDFDATPEGQLSQGFYGGLLSLRWVLNPGDLVEVSTLVGLGGHGLRANSDTHSRTTAADGSATEARSKVDSKNRGIDGRLGLVVEYRLLERLYLRLETHFASVGADHTSSSSHETSADGVRQSGGQTSDTLFLNFGFQPFLQLRVLL
jgi:hypothetical protein